MISTEVERARKMCFRRGFRRRKKRDKSRERTPPVEERSRRVDPSGWFRGRGLVCHDGAGASVRIPADPIPQM